MKIELNEVAKGSEHARVLNATTTSVESGHAVLVQAETEQRPTVLGLIASGRMKPDAGSVLHDGHRAGRALRNATALVDAPDVSDPDPNVLTVGVVAEELMYARKRSDPFSARKWMQENGFGDLIMSPIGTVEASRRVRMLCELAALRPGIEAIVVVSPDRHGGRPQRWWQVITDLADRGFAVMAIAGRASWEVLHGTAPRVNAIDDALATNSAEDEGADETEEPQANEAVSEGEPLETTSDAEPVEPEREMSEAGASADLSTEGVPQPAADAENEPASDPDDPAPDPDPDDPTPWRNLAGTAPETEPEGETEAGSPTSATDPSRTTSPVNEKDSEK